MTIWRYIQAEEVVRDHLHKIMFRSLRNNRGPMLSQVPTRESFEGSEHSIMREDGSEDCNAFSMVSSNHSVERHHDRPMELDEMEREFEKMGENFARQWNIDFYKQIDQSLERAGRKVHHGSSPQDLLTLLNDMWLDFEGPMKPRWPTMVCGGEAYAKITASWNQLISDPELYQKLVDLVARKYREWSNREAAKHLVD